ncbi:MAG: hypothetical protein AAFQ53_15700 [Bacteroidota bacterium]
MRTKAQDELDDLRAENAELRSTLTRRVGDALYSLSDLRSIEDGADFWAALDEGVSALRSAWIELGSPGGCPECVLPEHMGHRPNCRLAAALREGDDA